MLPRTQVLVATTVLAGALLGPAIPTASAYSTRLHILYANRVRDALIASGNGSIPLQSSDASVQLTDEDRRAIEENPLSFRAGFIGPDIFVFPGLSDLTHGKNFEPYRQCELLYEDAFTDEERAYALGCFGHAATDATAHHLVNFLTGETFTLNPITEERHDGPMNAVRHILAEEMLQQNAAIQSPSDFTSERMDVQFPNDFVMRNYWSTSSPIWQLATREAEASVQRQFDAQPDATYIEALHAAQLGPNEYVALLPRYVELFDQYRESLRAWMSRELLRLQDRNDPDGRLIEVSVGDDGVFGTDDDETSCGLFGSSACRAVALRYHAWTGLLAPRRDAHGRELPSAFDLIFGELQSDIHQLPRTYWNAVAETAANINSPLDSAGHGEQLSEAAIARATAGLTRWEQDLTSLDWRTMANAVIPDWMARTEATLRRLHIPVDIAAAMSALFDPALGFMVDLVQSFVTRSLSSLVRELLLPLQEHREEIDAEFRSVLAGATPGVDGIGVLDHFYQSGLYAHSFNLTAAAMGSRQVLLPADDDHLAGPASFDASYSMDWSQAGLCEGLRHYVFPLGMGVKGLLSLVSEDGRVLTSPLEADSPVECHSGSLASFSSPSSQSCEVTTLEDLRTSMMGSLSRAYPPQYASTLPACRLQTIPGVPVWTGPRPDVINISGDIGRQSDGGGCSVGKEQSSSLGWLFMLSAVLGRFVWRRRARRALHCKGSLMRIQSILLGLASFSIAACAANANAGRDDAGGPLGQVDLIVDGDAGDVPFDDAGSTGGGDSANAALLTALGDNVWSNRFSVVDDGAPYEEDIEMRFMARSLLWLEIRNPYGPGRQRTLRSFRANADGSISSRAMSPTGWEPSYLPSGAAEEWSFEVIAMPSGGSRLAVTDSEGFVEYYEPGAIAAPTRGWTAEVRSFTSGEVSDGFCSAGLSSFDRSALWNFARGQLPTSTFESDVLAGVRLEPWPASSVWGVTDLADLDRLGGTTMSATANYMVRYTGLMSHPGGSFSVREEDDDIRDALWVFAGPGVGSADQGDLLLEVHGRARPDATRDEPSMELPAGATPVEVLLLRCSGDVEAVSLQSRVADSGWQPMSALPVSPILSDELFPSGL